MPIFLSLSSTSSLCQITVSWSRFCFGVSNTFSFCQIVVSWTRLRHHFVFSFLCWICYFEAFDWFFFSKRHFQISRQFLEDLIWFRLHFFSRFFVDITRDQLSQNSIFRRSSYVKKGDSSSFIILTIGETKIPTPKTTSLVKKHFFSDYSLAVSSR